MAVVNFPLPSDEEVRESGPAPKPEPDPFANRFRFLSDIDGEILNTAPPPRQWLLKRGRSGVLPLGKVGLFVAAGGVGKTMALCGLAIAAALGHKWLGVFDVVRPGAVLLGLAEEDLPEVHRRLYAAAAAMGLSNDERRAAASRIAALALSGSDVALTQGDGRGNVTETTIAEALLRKLRGSSEELGIEWSLVIVDPLSRWAGNDTEKDSHAGTRFVEVLEGLTVAPGNPAVLAAHHTNKFSRRAGAPGGAENARGSTALTDGVRWVAELIPDGPNVVTFAVAKTNYGPPIEPVVLVRDFEFSGALRAMSPTELAEYTEEREASQTRGHRQPVPPSELEERVLATVRTKRGLTTKTAVVGATTGNKRALLCAVDRLVAEGRISVVDGEFRLTQTEPGAGTA